MKRFLLRLSRQPFLLAFWLASRPRRTSSRSHHQGQHRGNEEAAYVAGVPITITKITAYVISGVLAALASMILIGRLGAAEPILGNLWQLDAIAAAAIGGASLMGGNGSVVSTILGTIIFGAMRNGLTLMNVQVFYQLLANGPIILVAMMIDRVTRGKG